METKFEKTLNERDIWLILGAGISRSFPSSIPLWSEIKNDTIVSILDVLQKNKVKYWHSLPDHFQFDVTKDLLQQSINIPEMAMECLCDVYLESVIKDKLTDIIKPGGKFTEPNYCHNLIAEFICKYKVQGVITTNYDTLLEFALRDIKYSYNVVTPLSHEYKKFGIPIFKVHGTIYDSSSLIFIRDIYYKGLPQKLVDYLLNKINNSIIIICGYSGNDYDLFPICKQLIADNKYYNEAILVDPYLQVENSFYAPIKQKITHYNCSGEDYFSNILRKKTITEKARNSSSRTSATLLPHNDPYDCTLFVANAYMSINKYQEAYNYYYLADDIAADVDNNCGRGIASLGRSLCCFYSRMNDEGAREYNLALDTLRKVNIEDASSRLGPIGESLRMTLWIMRTRTLLVKKAISIALITEDTTIKKKLLKEASLNYAEYKHYDQGQDTSQTLKLISSSSRLLNYIVNTYRNFIVDGRTINMDALDSNLMECMENGSTYEFISCLYLINKILHTKQKKYFQLYKDTVVNLDENVVNKIEDDYRNPGEPFLTTPPYRIG